jgi:uncharacterized membrane protein YeaQ/YmgE (transglycosylase-associated protein family)
VSLNAIIVLVVVGCIVGWLAGLIWKGSGFGFVGNVVVGIVGSFIGRFLFKALGISFHGIVGTIVPALAGALVLLLIVNAAAKR